MIRVVDELIADIKTKQDILYYIDTNHPRKEELLNELCQISDLGKMIQERQERLEFVIKEVCPVAKNLADAVKSRKRKRESI